MPVHGDLSLPGAEDLWGAIAAGVVAWNCDDDAAVWLDGDGDAIYDGCCYWLEILGAACFLTLVRSCAGCLRW